MPISKQVGGIALGLVVPILFFAVLEVGARLGKFNPVFLPPPSMIFREVLVLLVSGRFLAPLFHTLWLLLCGLGIGCFLAIAVGLLMGWSVRIHNLLEPLVELLRPIPKPALLPPLILFLGIGPSLEITIVSLGVFFPVLINTVQGVRSVDPVMVDTAKTFGHGRFTVWFRILFPASLPYIFTGLRVALGIGFILTIIAEMLAGNGGLGDVIVTSQRSFRVTESYAWLVILTVAGFAATVLFNVCERRVIRWREVQG